MHNAVVIKLDIESQSVLNDVDYALDEFQDVDDTVLFIVRALQALHYKQEAIKSELIGKRYGNVGCLLTVHNGHNGWLGKDSLQLYFNHIVRMISSSVEDGGCAFASTCDSY